MFVTHIIILTQLWVLRLIYPTCSGNLPSEPKWVSLRCEAMVCSHSLWFEAVCVVNHDWFTCGAQGKLMHWHVLTSTPATFCSYPWPDLAGKSWIYPRALSMWGISIEFESINYLNELYLKIYDLSTDMDMITIVMVIVIAIIAFLCNCNREVSRLCNRYCNHDLVYA